MLTPGVQGEKYCPVQSVDIIWWSTFIHQYSYRTEINLPAGRHPWPWWKKTSGLKHCYSSSRQGDEWMEGVIGLWKRVTLATAATLFLLPLLSALGKIKIKWMAALVIKQLVGTSEDGWILKINEKANE